MCAKVNIFAAHKEIKRTKYLRQKARLAAALGG